MLFEPIKLGNLEVPNRFVRSATNEWLAGDDGTPTTAISDMYEELARNDVGLIITGYSYVNPQGRSNEKQQGIYADMFIVPYHEITSVVHKYDSKIVAQIVHGGRQSLVREDTVLLGPSAVKDETSGKMPVEMTEEEILQTIEDFVEAARRT